MRAYQPSDHYWIVAGDESRLWSSARTAYVDAADADLAAWQDAGGFPTLIATEEDLRDVLAHQFPDGWPADLVAYAGVARLAAEVRGITVAGAPIKTDRDSQSMISGAYSYTQASGASVRFKTGAGFVTISPPQLEAIALAVGAHVQACFAKEADVLAAIEAGDITTPAEVDAAFETL